jgi:protoheme IX farnesyltransferase
LPAQKINIPLLKRDIHTEQGDGFSKPLHWKYFIQLSKLRLTSLVVLTAAIGYLVGVRWMITADFEWSAFIGLMIGGFLLTASSNAFNQILERDSDRLMNRTSDRPLASQKMNLMDAILFAFITGVVSLLVLGLALNATAAFIGLASLVVYSFIYTPVKKMSPIAVFIGAFPGAVPPMLGFVGATGSFTFEALLLFGIQFFWQFPHFWSLAWVLNDDYMRAGYFMLPSRQGKTKRSAFQIVWYSLIMLLMSTVPYYTLRSGFPYLIIALLSGTVIVWLALQLFKTLDNHEAKRLMFATFFYIPIILLALML